MARLKTMVDACRTLRGEMGVSPAQRLPLLAVADTAEDSAFLRANAGAENLAKLSEVKVFDDAAAWASEAQNAPVNVVGGARLALFVEIDVAAEKARLSKAGPRASRAKSQRPTPTRQRSLLRQGPAAVLEQEKKAPGRLWQHAGAHPGTTRPPGLTPALLLE